MTKPTHKGGGQRAELTHALPNIQAEEEKKGEICPDVIDGD